MDGNSPQPAGGELRDEVAALRRRVEALERSLAELTRPQQVPAPYAARIAHPPTEPAKGTLPLDASSPGNEWKPPARSAGQPSDLESRIGAQIFNRVGIFAVLAAAAWFLKLAIDREWIGPAVRVVLGLLVAVGLFIWSERFRRSGSLPFSFSLKALASGIAYLSLWAAFNLYHLLDAGLIFAAMVAVTITNALLAWRQNSELLAALALAGGLATPALLTTGGDHELFLLSYLLVLDIGALVLMSVRPWPRLALGGFLGTTVYLGLAWNQYFERNQDGVTGVFIALFFALFTLAPFLEGRGRSVEGHALEDHKAMLAALPIAVGLCAFIEADHLLLNVDPTASAYWIGLLLGGIYLALVIASSQLDVFFNSDQLAKVQLGLSVGFFALAAVSRYRGYGVPLFWLAELVLLAIAAHQFAAGPLARTLRGCAATMLLLSFSALLLLNEYDRQPLGKIAFTNAHFATYVAGLAAFALVVAAGLNMLHEDTAFSTSYLSFHSWRFLIGSAVIAFNIVALLAVSLQIELYWRPQLSPRRASNHFHHPAYIDFTYSAWFMLYGALLMTAGFVRRSAFLRWQALILLTLSIGKVFLFDTSHLNEGYRVLSFLGLGVLLLAVSFVYQRDLLGLKQGARTELL